MFLVLAGLLLALAAVPLGLASGVAAAVFGIDPLVGIAFAGLAVAVLIGTSFAVGRLLTP
jgi:hypothetical protein